MNTRLAQAYYRDVGGFEMDLIKACARHVCLHLLVIMASVTCHKNTIGQTNQNRLKPVVTRQTSFTIPFHVRPVKQPDQKAIEVQLHVSEDNGTSWQLYSRQHPSATNFHFRAPGDGEYWFAVRTVDRTGREFPGHPLALELSVIVDTVPPQLSLFAGVGTAGEVKTHWEASDERIDARSLVVEYRSGSGSEWRRVAVDSNNKNQNVLSGQAHWWPRTNQQNLYLRAQIKDTAGNTAIVQRQLEIPNLAASSVRVPKLTSHLPRLDGGIGWPSADRRSTIEGRNDLSNPNSVNSNKPDLWNARLRSSSVTTLPVPDQRSKTGLHTHNQQFHHQQKSSEERHNTVGRLISNSRDVPHRSTVHLPQGVIPILSRSQRFTLDYDLNSVGPSGVRSVQLWVTPDGGHSWTKWTEDEDRKSPIEVEVDREGVYGFTIIVENNEGLSASFPQPGNIPDFWIGVDQTKPYAELTSAKYGTGAKTGRLDIHWKASDDFLVDRPVTLKFSSDPSAGWQSIVSNIANSGKFSWNVDRHIPQKVYLRLEVLDRSGNLGVHELSEPVSTRGLVPKARIRGMRQVPQADVRGLQSSQLR